MTTSDLVRGTIIPCLIGLIVLSALNLGGTIALLYCMKKQAAPTANVELKVVMPEKQEGPVKVSVEKVAGKQGSATVNGERIW